MLKSGYSRELLEIAADRVARKAREVGEKSCAFQVYPIIDGISSVRATISDGRQIAMYFDQSNARDILLSDENAPEWFFNVNFPVSWHYV